MKKIAYLTLLIILSISIKSCSGYKPIFSTSNLNFKDPENNKFHSIFEMTYTTIIKVEDKIDNKEEDQCPSCRGILI